MSWRVRRLVAANRAYRGWAARRGMIAATGRKVARLRVALWNFVCGSDISPASTLPADLALPHPNGVVMHDEAIVGPGCMIMQQVTLGQLAGAGAPTVGKAVYIGAGAKVLGGITIGDGARIGANAVVLHDVPQGATVVGIPASVVRRQTADGDPS